MGELSNQLESLQRMTPQGAREALQIIQPSSLCRQTLRDPELRGQIVRDDLGERVVLQINWTRRHPGQPIESWLPGCRLIRLNRRASDEAI